MTSDPHKETKAPTQAQIDEALQGTDTGSDTRAGSLRGGSSSGSDVDPDQDIINAELADEGRALSQERSHHEASPDEVGKSDTDANDDADEAKA